MCRNPLGITPVTALCGRRTFLRRSAQMVTSGVLASISLTALAGCAGGGNSFPIGGTPAQFDFDLGADSANWEGGFADLPIDPVQQEIYQLQFERNVALPSNLSTGRAILIGGTNHSDDLFMFLKRHLTGLDPYRRYRASFEVRFASNAPANAAGVGGAPGEGVILRACLTAIEPLAVASPVPGDPNLRMNIDKGGQAFGGVDVVVLGNIAVDVDIHEPVYQFKTLTSEGKPSFYVTTDATGSLWLSCGSDSGFEARTTLYYTRVIVKLTPA